MSSEGKEEAAVIMLPGDTLDLPGDVAAVRVGPGLRQKQQQQQQEQQKMLLEAYRVGILRHKTKPTDAYWLDSSHKHDEMVLGIVTAAMGDDYAVDIGSNLPARLNALSFEGATKRTRARLAVGDLIYGRLTLCNKDMDPEMSCITAAGKANGMGKLEGGYLVECSLGLARQLQNKASPVLQLLGRKMQFELAVGLNGRFWVNAPKAIDVVVVANTILASEHMSSTELRRLVNKVTGQR